MNAYLTRLLTDFPLIANDWLARLAAPDERVKLVASAFGTALAGVTIEAAEHPMLSRLRGELSIKPKVTDDGIAVLAVNGPLAYKPDVFEMLFDGVEDSSQILSLLNAFALDGNIKGVLLDINSPGGSVTGGFEMADALAAVSAVKPTVAYTGGMMASLAYLLGSQASEIVASKGASVGSIGVIASWLDFTGYLEKLGIKAEVFTNTGGDLKGIGTPGRPMSDAQREHMQESVDAIFTQFASTVRANRPGVPDSAMRGQVYRGSDAKGVGLIDRIGNQDFAMSVLRARVRSKAA